MPRGRYRSWTDDELRAAVARHTNRADVIRELGLRPAGGNLFFESSPRFERRCRTLPVPPGSALTAQTSSVSAVGGSSFLTFRTDDRAAVDLFYLAWAEANGFGLQPTDENAGARLSFRSESDKLLVELIDYSATEYVVRCAEEAPESEH